MKGFILKRMLSGVLSLVILSAALPFAAASSPAEHNEQQIRLADAAVVTATDKVSYHITTNHPEAVDDSGIDRWMIVAVKGEGYDFTSNNYNDESSIIQMLLTAPDNTAPNTATIALKAGDVIRISAPKLAEYSVVELVINGKKIQTADTPQPGKLCCPDPVNWPLINVYVVPEGLTGVQEMQVNFVDVETPSTSEEPGDEGGSDMIDAYGRSYKRVVGGTYYAEQTGENTYIERIRQYICPSNNGGKHQLEYHKQAPTCAKNDYNYYYCTLCGETELIADHPALGHDYKGEITQPATATADGVMTYTCTRCGDQYTEMIEKFGGKEDTTEEHSVQKDPNAQATVTNNKGKNAYSAYSASPMKSYLYSRSDGGYTRVEALRDKVIVEAYDQDFQLLTSDSVPMELPIFGGFYGGNGYNFLIFGQENQEENDQKEVVRVVKYSKDWERLGQASLRGANTVIPFEAGSLRCTEYNGYLYVQTSHEMYTSSDGLNHQANLTFCVKQSEMKITDSQYRVSNISDGYVSHSFNQFILVDEEGRLVTLNHGDAIPRGAVLVRYHNPAGSDTFVSRLNESKVIQTFADSKKHYNYTGALLGGLCDSAANYLSVYSIVPSGGNIEDHDVKNVVVAVSDKDDLSDTTTCQLTSYTDGGAQSADTPAMVKLSSNRFLIVWNILERDRYGYYRAGSKIGYAFVDGNGRLSGSIRTAQGALSDCQPVYDGTDVVWYYTSNSTPTFCTINAATGAFACVGAQPGENISGGQTGGEDAKPGEGIQQPDNTQTGEPEGGEAAQPGVSVSFVDIPSGYWGSEAITKAAQNGLMIGVGNNKFDPEGNLTIAQVLTLAYRLHHQHSGEELPDVSAVAAWYLPYYQYCVENGIIYAEEVSSMGLDDRNITRNEMVRILNKAVSDEQMEAVKQVSNGDIPDVDEDAEYGAEIYRWYRAGVLVGNSDGLFHGDSALTRAEVATILCRLYGLSV